VEDVWKEDIRGTPMFQLCSKLKIDCNKKYGENETFHVKINLMLRKNAVIMVPFMGNLILI